MIRKTLAIAALTITLLSLPGCKSDKDRQSAYDQCMKGCITQHLPGGAGSETTETALRRTLGGGQCMTRCKKMLEKRDVMGTIKSWMD